MPIFGFNNYNCVMLSWTTLNYKLLQLMFLELTSYSQLRLHVKIRVKWP